MSQEKHYHPRAPGLAAGVSEDMIRELVHAFYGKVRRDPALGPIFNTAIEDWDAHLSKLCDFWSSILLMTGAYKGRPVPAHLALPDIRATHFARWLHLFRETAGDVCPEAAASLFIERAERIAESLQLAISIHRGELTVHPPDKTKQQPSTQSSQPARQPE